MAEFQELHSLDNFEGKEVFIYTSKEKFPKKYFLIKQIFYFICIYKKKDYIKALISQNNINIKGWVLENHFIILRIELRILFGIKGVKTTKNLKKYAKKHPIALLNYSALSDVNFKALKQEFEGLAYPIAQTDELDIILKLKEMEEYNSISSDYLKGLIRTETNYLKNYGHLGYLKPMNLPTPSNCKKLMKISLPKVGNVTLSDSIKLLGYNSLIGITMHGVSGLDSSIRSFLIRNKNSFNWIAGVREPISLVISMAFCEWSPHSVQIARHMSNYDCFNPNHLIHKLINYDLSDEGSVFESLLYDNYYDYDIINFFDKEYKEILGIDVYLENFDTKRGYSIINQDGTQLMIYRLENMNELEQEFSAFFGIDNFKLSIGNEAEKKWYGLYYDKFKKHDFRITQGDFDKLYNSKYMKHFYAEDEISKFKKKWKWAIVANETML